MEDVNPIDASQPQVAEPTMHRQDGQNSLDNATDGWQLSPPQRSAPSYTPEEWQSVQDKKKHTAFVKHTAAAFATDERCKDAGPSATHQEDVKRTQYDLGNNAVKALEGALRENFDIVSSKGVDDIGALDMHLKRKPFLVMKTTQLTHMKPQQSASFSIDI